MAHNVVTAATVNPVTGHLATLGHRAGYDPLIGLLAASLAAKMLDELDFDVDALVAHYHTLVKGLS